MKKALVIGGFAASMGLAGCAQQEEVVFVEPIEPELSCDKFGNCAEVAPERTGPRRVDLPDAGDTGGGFTSDNTGRF